MYLWLHGTLHLGSSLLLTRCLCMCMIGPFFPHYIRPPLALQNNVSHVYPHEPRREAGLEELGNSCSFTGASLLALASALVATGCSKALVPAQQAHHKHVLARFAHVQMLMSSHVPALANTKSLWSLAAHAMTPGWKSARVPSEVRRTHSTDALFTVAAMRRSDEASSFQSCHPKDELAGPEVHRAHPEQLRHDYCQRVLRRNVQLPQIEPQMRSCDETLEPTASGKH
ncbi:unnamed protein product [Prorocentrum cordatum]|uniref:Uncharacterized protein n=1 Tax=Prorocentrum cordatum TaxID=2364126 RepID=A0ABN9WQQ3_9DINO|nr:unnamed protein product [Polarella glacialis]